MSLLFPGEYLDSTYVIDFDKLYDEGYRAVIFDVDNTLVPHGAPADERAISLFSHLKEKGYSCMLLSNNKEPRVKMFNDAVQVNYIFKANKPMPLKNTKSQSLRCRRRRKMRNLRRLKNTTPTKAVIIQAHSLRAI